MNKLKWNSPELTKYERQDIAILGKAGPGAESLSHVPS